MPHYAQGFIMNFVIQTYDMSKCSIAKYWHQMGFSTELLEYASLYVTL